MSKLGAWFEGEHWGREGARGRRRRDRAARHFREHEIRHLWRAGAIAGGLGERVFSPSGTTVVVPVVTDVHLGVTERFTIRLRATQTMQELTNAGRIVANTFAVPAIGVTEIARGWVEIELDPILPAASGVGDEPDARSAAVLPFMPPAAGSDDEGRAA